MALTREFLKRVLAGNENIENQVDSIIEAHVETVDGLKAEIEKYKGDAEEVNRITEEIERLKAAGVSEVDENGVPWHERYNAVTAELDAAKAEGERRDIYAEKEKAFRSMLLQAGVKYSLVDVIVRGSREMVEAVEIQDGSVRNAESVAAAIRHDFGDIIGSTSAAQAHDVPLTKAGIMSITDRSERLAAMQANPGLFQ